MLRAEVSLAGHRASAAECGRAQDHGEAYTSWRYECSTDRKIEPACLCVELLRDDPLWSRNTGPKLYRTTSHACQKQSRIKTMPLLDCDLLSLRGTYRDCCDVSTRSRTLSCARRGLPMLRVLMGEHNTVHALQSHLDLAMSLLDVTLWGILYGKTYHSDLHTVCIPTATLDPVFSPRRLIIFAHCQDADKYSTVCTPGLDNKVVHP